MKPFPRVTEAHIVALRAAFPNESPRRGETHEEMLIRAGHAEVIAWLEVKSKD